MQIPQSAKEWMGALAQYRTPKNMRSIWEIFISAAPLAVLCVAAYFALEIHFLLAWLLCIPAAFFLVRLFLILHDCSHGSFFESKAANLWVGRVIGILVVTPFDVWRRSHLIHHAGSGNLDRRGIGDVHTLTVAEYRALSKFDRFKYRLYRHPFVLFGIGPIFVFMLHHRLPIGMMKEGPRYWISAMATNLGIAALVGGCIALVGWKAFLLLYLPIVIMGATIGVWLFFVQHQFEDTFWEAGDAWKLHDAALYGSSYYDLPRPLAWLTANIGVHHVHHLYARIPFYRLGKVMRDYPALKNMRRLTLLESLRCVRYKLWCEARGRMVTFAEV